MADDAAQDDLRAHMDTYTSFNKLVTFMILWLILLLSSMALGLVAHQGLISTLLGVGGTFALIAGFVAFG